MKKMLQIASACEWEAVFFYYDNGKVFREPVVCWAFVSERPFVENGEDEAKYIEGQVVLNGGDKIGGVYEVPENIGFLGYLYSKLTEQRIKERMDHFIAQSKELMELRKSGHVRQ